MKLGQGNVFTGASYSVNRGGYASVHAGIAPRPGTTPRTRHHPQDQAPPGPGPPDTPMEQIMLGDMVNEQAVHILLECNFVVYADIENVCRFMQCLHHGNYY